MVRFDELSLDPAIVRNLTALGLREARPIQRDAIPAIITGSDLIGLAPTGTGKTAAFAVGVAERLRADSPPRRRRGARTPRPVRAIILCPTRELVQQVASDIERIVKGLGLGVIGIHGKTGKAPQREALARGAEILVATPGRARELIDDGALDLGYVRIVVLDEADRLLDLGFRPQIDEVLLGAPADRQTLLFTATMPPAVEALATAFLRDPKRIDVGQLLVAPHVAQRLVAVHDRDKVPLLLHLLSSPREAGGAIVFCRTRRRVGWVAAALARHAIRIGELHGDRSQAQRERALDRLGSGEVAVLVATDVVARGLHVPAVTLVINYDMPLEPEEFVHRTGRAAHGGGRVGEAISLLSKPDLERWARISKALGLSISRESIPGFHEDLDEHAKETAADSVPPPERRSRARASWGRGHGRGRARSRPIGKGEKPGCGVKRLGDGGGAGGAAGGSAPGSSRGERG